jgi:glycosyltransferase involved in cell wall biosynthesis
VALIEALAFGVTPVVTDIPSFRAITSNGRLGALFSPGDPAAFARAVVRLGAVDLGGQRREVRAHFERNLSWPAIGRKALESYRAVADARAERLR